MDEKERNIKEKGNETVKVKFTVNGKKYKQKRKFIGE
jgi:hypothetical protein